jgi:hypothetical protein
MSAEGFESLKCPFYRLWRRMDISLAHGHAAVPSDPHDCKRICTRLAQSGQDGVAKGMQDECLKSPVTRARFQTR